MNVSKTDLEASLSALADGVLDVHEERKLLEKLALDTELAQTWRHYNLIKAGVSGRAQVVPDAGFASRVSAAIAEEPVVLAPKALRPKQMKQRLERVMTFAMAAGFMGVAILATQNSDQWPLNIASAKNSMSQPAATGSIETASMESRLNDYLLNHNEATYMMGTQGLFPYARVVTINTNGR